MNATLMFHVCVCVVCTCMFISCIKHVDISNNNIAYCNCVFQIYENNMKHSLMYSYK